MGAETLWLNTASSAWGNDIGNRRGFLKTIVSTAAATSMHVAAPLAHAAPVASAAIPEAVDHIPRIDFSTPVGVMRALQGVNKGPLAAGGLVDVIAAHRELGIPLTRLHDCHWPVPDVVDMHVVFPDAKADPARPESYDFRMTDEYIAAVRATGSEILYRLGETIEHTSVKRFVHPPQDASRWAAAAIGIIRHYNEGWASGFHYDIRRWEIWNEPENQPSMWTGTNDQFFRFYSVVARSIKAAFPKLMVGGPGIGITGDLINGDLKPSAFLTGFLERCRRDSLPLDFLSWHCYSSSSNPQELPLRARCIRRLMDEYGFKGSQSYLDEWRNIPDNDWAPISRSTEPLVRQKWYARMVGAESAAYIVAVLLGLQDAPVEAANFFHGELGGFGMFDESGVPFKNYYGMLAFRRLLDTPQRAQVHGLIPEGITIGAGSAADKNTVAILVSSYARTQNAQTQSPIRLKLEGLPWRNPVVRTAHIVDGQHDLVSIPDRARLQPGNILSLSLQTPAVALITLANSPR